VSWLITWKTVVLKSIANPDLILLDVMMPGIDGFETCQRLKADEETAGMPVIFMRNLDSTEDKLKGFEVGGVDYATKPRQNKEVRFLPPIVPMVVVG